MLGREYTIDEYISEYNKLDVSFDTLHFKEVYIKSNGNIMILLGDSLLLKYDNELKSKIISLKLSDKEFRMYAYNPKLLSFELYNTTELWGLLLHVNNIFSLTQFNFNPIKVYNKSILKTIDTILNLEHDAINNNAQTVHDRTVFTI